MIWEPNGGAHTDHASSPTKKRVVDSLQRAGTGRSLADRQLVECARQLIKARAEVAKHIPVGLFRDAAWDIVLELFVNGEEGGIVYVKQLIIASGQPNASAVRLIDRLENARMLERKQDPLDHRRIIVGLTSAGREMMFALLNKVFEFKDQSEGRVTPRSFQPRR